MLIKNSKQTIAAFVAQEIKAAQQLEVKGGNGTAKDFIHVQDVIVL